MGTMQGVILPGNSTVEFGEFPVPEPGHGQVLVRIRASSICGSDIRAIYRAHLGKGPEGWAPSVSRCRGCSSISRSHSSGRGSPP